MVYQQQHAGALQLSYDYLMRIFGWNFILDTMISQQGIDKGRSCGNDELSLHSPVSLFLRCNAAGLIFPIFERLIYYEW